MRADPHVQRFDLVALPYDLFFHSQRRAFRRVLLEHGGGLGLAPGARILDIGCGTGAFATVLADHGFRVSAVEPSRGMRARARRHFKGTGIVLEDANALDGLPYPDSTFDAVVTSYVVHGLRSAARAVFYREAFRVSKGLVVINDYAPLPPRRRFPDVPVMETLERSDYHRFIRTGTAGMRRVFASVEVVAIGPGSAWYVCRAAALG